MLRRTAGDRQDKNRERRQAAAMGCGIMLCAVIITLTIAARAEITALSDETARLETELAELKEQRRALKAEYEYAVSAPQLYDRGTGLGMEPPSAAGYSFAEPADSDMTVVCVPEDGQQDTAEDE